MNHITSVDLKKSCLQSLVFGEKSWFTVIDNIPAFSFYKIRMLKKKEEKNQGNNT